MVIASDRQIMGWILNQCKEGCIELSAEAYSVLSADNEDVMGAVTRFTDRYPPKSRVRSLYQKVRTNICI